MKHLLRLKDFTKEDILKIFSIVDEIQAGGYRDYLKGKSVLLFFPETSIRTRVTFEKGIQLLGGQSILFSPETLEKKESLNDVMGYLNNWADMIVVRHKDIKKMEELSETAKVPVINAMTSDHHPCEILSDMYALSKIREDFTKDKYLFVGLNQNIGNSWKDASDLMGFELSQCCAYGYEIEGITNYYNIEEAVQGKDIVCTDSLPEKIVRYFHNCHVTKAVMDMANPGAVLNPCPPFYRGEEVSEDAIDSEHFVGYEFKKHLLTVQQAIMIYCMEN